MKITVNEAKAKRVFKKQYPDGLQLELEASEPLYSEEPASVYLSLHNSKSQFAPVDIRDVLEKGKAPYSDIAREVYRRLRKEATDPFYRIAADAKKLKPEYVADFLAKAPVDTILKEAEAIDQREAAERDAKAVRDAERAKAKQAAADAKFKARGKWEILWDSYDDGNRYKKSFRATDDKDALRTILDKWDWCGPISEPAEKICPNKAEQKELIASGDFEDGDWFNSVKAALKFLDDGNGDGCDLVYYIRRPDGSYLFESGIEPESWDN